MKAVLEKKKAQANPNHLGKAPFFSPGPVQKKLEVNLPGDKFEVEADQVAEHIVQKISGTHSETVSTDQPTPLRKPESIGKSRVPNPLPTGPPKNAAPNHIYTKCAACEAEEQEKPGEEEIQRKIDSPSFLQAAGTEDDEDTSLMAKRGSAAASIVSAETAADLFASKGEGDPLQKNTQAEMERGFGVDFSRVRIHTDPSAVKMSKNLGAQAFTHGSDIYFNQGKFDTQSKEGKRLLAHELTHVVQQGKAETGMLQREEGSDLADDAITTGDIADKVEHKYNLITKESKEYLIGKYAKGKFSLKISMIRGKSPGVKGETKVGVPGTDIEGPVDFSAKAGTLETDLLFQKYAVKFGSFAGEGELDLGCNLRLKVGVDLIKIQEGGKVKFGLPSPSASVRLEKADFDNPGGCPITQMLSHGGSEIPALVALGWKVDVELKFDISLDPAEMAKAIAIKKAQKALEDLGKKSDDIAEKIQREAKEWERKQARKAQKAARRGKRFKRTPFEKTSKGKALKKKAEDVAKKIAGKTAEIAKIGKGMESPWGRKFAEKSFEWAKTFGKKVLGKLLVVLAVLDAAVTIAKIIKHWDSIYFKLPWESGGRSLDDVSLFDDLPSGGTKEGDDDGGAKSDSGTKRESSDSDSEGVEEGETDGGEPGAAKSDDAASKPSADDAGAAPEKDAGDSGGPDLTNEPDEEQAKTGSVGVSKETLEKIRKSPEPVQQLVLEIISGEIGPEITDDQIGEILKRIPPTLTQEQSDLLQDMIEPEEGQSFDDLLKNLEKAIAGVTNPTTTEPAAPPDATPPNPPQQLPPEGETKPDQTPEPKPAQPGKPEPSPDSSGAQAPGKQPDDSATQTQSGSEYIKGQMFDYIVFKVLKIGDDKKFSKDSSKIADFKENGMHYSYQHGGRIVFSVIDITVEISELIDAADPKRILQQIYARVELKVESTGPNENNEFDFKIEDVLSKSGQVLYDPSTGDIQEIDSTVLKQLEDLTEIVSGQRILKPSARNVAHDFGSFWAKVEIQSKGDQLTQVTFHPTKLNDPNAFLTNKGEIVTLKVGTPVKFDL